LATALGYAFDERRNEVLELERFDTFAKSRCARFYATGIGDMELMLGFFRYFQGIGAERGIALR
jgi:hypothetical protein